jgi:hypothetical protein
MKEKKSLPISFQIKAIEILDTCINSPKQPLGAETVFQFDINLEQAINIDKAIVVVICFVSIFNEEKIELFGKLRSSCVYTVENLSQYVNSETKAVEFPEPFLVTLNSISLSTARGLMFSFFRGTFLHNAVLPILDPASFSIERK